MRNIFLFMAMAFAINLFGQARVDGQRKYTVLASSPIVTNFVGWAYDSSKEKWAGYYNTIWDSNRGNNKNPIRTSATNMSHNHNIVSLQVKKVQYHETIYYAIIYTSWTGYYDYPSIYEGWHPYKHHQLLMFDENDYMKIFSLNVGEDPTIVWSKGKGYEEITSEKSVNGLFNDYFNGKNLGSYGQMFLSFKKEDNNTIRFIGPTQSYASPTSFDRNYYEIKMTTFKSLFIK